MDRSSKVCFRSCLFLLLVFAVSVQARDGWEKVGLVNSVQGPTISYVQFFDDENGVIAGDDGFIRYTRNGGVTWRELKLPRLSGVNEDIVAGSWRGSMLYLLTSRRLLKSKNYGDSWEVVKQPKPSSRLRDSPGPEPDIGYFDMTFVSEREGWVLCGALKKLNGDYTFLRSYLLHTNDAGASWRTTELKTGRRQMERMHFADKNHGWIVGADGTILHTDDGENWEQQTYPIQEGGRVSGFKPELLDIDFKGKDRGIIVGRLGTILRTEDGGRHWFLIRLPSFKAKAERRNLHRVQMVDKEYAWVVGKSGGIFMTDDGGLSWSQQDSQTTEDLFTVFMLNRKEGWAAGVNKTVLKYEANDNNRGDYRTGDGQPAASASVNLGSTRSAYYE